VVPLSAKQHEDNGEIRCYKKIRQKLSFHRRYAATDKRKQGKEQSKRYITQSFGVHEATLRKRLKAGTVPTSLEGLSLYSPQRRK
jgi:hypothetical protein